MFVLRLCILLKDMSCIHGRFYWISASMSGLDMAILSTKTPLRIPRFANLGGAKTDDTTSTSSTWFSALLNVPKS